jgi:biopolymer transport protein ExbD
MHGSKARRLPTKKKEADHVKNDINVTPLVDVMLVLLIIFMLMTLVMGRGQELKLPNAKNYSEEKDKQQPVVSIDKDGYLYVEKTKLGQVAPLAHSGDKDADARPNAALLLEMRNQIETKWKSPVTIEAGGAGRVYLKAQNDTSYDYIYPVLYYLNREMQVPAIDIAIQKEGK